MRQTIIEFFFGKKSQLWALGLVAVLALTAANAAWLLPTLDELETNAYVLHRSFALDVRNQTAAFLGRYENSLGNAVDIINQNGALGETTVYRLMKENQPFESLTLLDQNGRESLKNHRFLLITPADLKDRSGEDLFKVISRGEIYRGPVLVSGISEPLITIALPLRKESGFSAIVADVNLKFLLDVVRGIKIGDQGETYVVDRDGFIIAHPNSSLVFGRVNILERKIIATVLSGREADTRDATLVYNNEKGENVFAVALPFALTGWGVVVENPRSFALASSRRILSAAIISFVLEILLLFLLVWNYFNLVRAAALFYSERNQREAILNSLSDGVIEYNDQSQIILMNPRAEELLGVKFSDISGVVVTPELAKTNDKLKGLVELMYPALAPYASSVKQVLGAPFTKTMEVHISAPDLRLLITMTHVVDRAGNVRGFLKILHDISREKLLTRLKSEFVSIAAHQLRTPLSAIKWTLRLLLDGDAGALSKEQLDFLSKGYETNERMIKLVNDLLNAARIEEGKFGYEFRDIDLGEFLRDAVKNYTGIVRQKSIDLRLEGLTKSFPLIYADQEKLTLAFNNLLENAIKYTTVNGKITIKPELKGDYAIVSISDTGVGIPAAEQKRVFSKFFRASNVIRMETEGTGLGLFIVRNIIRRHGGDIQFVSKEGQGSSFVLTLPVKKELVPSEETQPLEEFLETI
ncbi:hypothetical protein A3G55_02080 [Candidatus Giovannonibacteria bacterium RIFCSPLOWO2_12_FULL_44_25]|uniref:histidine kinase n=4 Tax=Parcubacteria group TaxID=1794811 RepID=A0A837IQL7_9BACT|nr:MAG: hypothetical protein UW15_C0007G0004 [Parcubacteria group bacterium GW2011_GWC1_44_10]KKT56868.1 MAG: hypothetical protein UW49_C0012G0004 [Candidatus Giovannonibacteria bacterium GW2011_GWB1_44_23]KKT59437.1 MAG: hypothetical protein UW53_C0012G0004 [Candidatus Giovannonibacteria bacterium GW2011_GWA1_44_25]KKU12037.1 MAG: hypothetical protein UX18_C0033G0003 [Candidatus Azambacteria bacterium GW2011_GWC2_45_7b]OGF49585.1 MAG: hypothetical protein A2120_04205 [Candidatus Giovannonibact